MVSKINANSLIKAMFTSLCVFSITLLASATLILDALCVPATIIDLYNSSISVAISGVDPEVTFKILVTVRSLSPGLIRSGLYPQKKSLLNFKVDIFSSSGTHISSVTPG